MTVKTIWPNAILDKFVDNRHSRKYWNSSSELDEAVAIYNSTIHGEEHTHVYKHDDIRVCIIFPKIPCARYNYHGLELDV